MPEGRALEHIWGGHAATHRIVRAALAPAAALFRATTALRNDLYDRGVLRAIRAPIPVVSVGNLSVGGTGKTPVAAWVARTLLEGAHRPAIVLRGYGADEPLVHRALNPGIPVIVAPDRVAGVADAAAGGATVAVLDDAFQHRRIARDLDIVLVAAEEFGRVQRTLPAGPWREPPSALSRASLVLVTRKSATEDEAGLVRDALRGLTEAPVAIVSLEPAALRDIRGDVELDLATLAGKEVLLIAAIGRPGALARQMEHLGAHCRHRFFPDHHAFSDAEVAALARESAGFDLAVCTLKDAVKLAPRWPRAAARAWYVSQRVRLTRDGDAVHALLRALPPLP